MEFMNSTAVVGAFALLAKRMQENRERLIALDSVMGDGDLGITMCQGFSLIAEKLAGTTELDIGLILGEAGTTLMQSVPSTMGTLLGFGLIKAGNALSGMQQLGAPEVATIFEAMTEAMMHCGKSRPGDKTVIDALYPAMLAMRGAADAKLPLCSTLDVGLAAAIKGSEATEQMVAKHGRIAYYGEQSLGHLDPGSVAATIIVQSFADYAHGTRAM